MTVRPRLAITLGDAAGIGPEVIAKALPREVDLGRSIPVVIGDARVVEQELERHAPGWKVVRVDLPETFETRGCREPYGGRRFDHAGCRTFKHQCNDNHDR